MILNTISRSIIPMKQPRNIINPINLLNSIINWILIVIFFKKKFFINNHDQEESLVNTEICTQITHWTIKISSYPKKWFIKIVKKSSSFLIDLNKKDIKIGRCLWTKSKKERISGKSWKLSNKESILKNTKNTGKLWRKKRI